MGSFVHRAAGRVFVAAYRQGRRAVSKGFSLAASGSFASYGARSVIQVPVRLEGEQWIEIGDDVTIGPNSWLRAAPEDTGRANSPILSVGAGTSVVGSCVFSAVASIRIGKRVLFARNVYVADHMHAFEDRGVAVLDQGVSRVARVEIGDGAWIGEGVYVGPGVRIGIGAVVGANAVVLDDVPDFAIAAGVPARVIRTIDGT